MKPVLPRRHVRMFDERFAAKVEARRKISTIRDTFDGEVGDVIDCRTWEGVPYRQGSRKRWLLEGVIVEISLVRIRKDGLDKNFGPLGWEKSLSMQHASHRPLLHDFAAAEGFADWADLLEYFKPKHGKPYVGKLIIWDPRIAVVRAKEESREGGQS